MSRSRFHIFVFVFLILSVLLSACGGDAFVPSGWSGLAVDGDTAYVANNQYVYAVRVSDGVQIWRHPQENPQND